VSAATSGDVDKKGLDEKEVRTPGRKSFGWLGWH